MIKLTALFLVLSVPAFAASFSVTYPQTAFVYAATSGILRRIIIPGVDETATENLAAGESYALQPQGAKTDEASIITIITGILGHPPANSKCAVVHNADSKVTHLIRCDPTLDAMTDASLILSDKAFPGDQWHGNHFEGDYAEIHPTSRKVEKISHLPIDNPQATISGHRLQRAGSLKVGDTIPQGPQK